MDFDANLAVARAAIAAGVKRMGLVSAMGANARSGVFYSRVKGELEDALTALPLEALVIARPSLLTGDRSALGQPGRRLERLFLGLSSAIAPMVPASVRPIEARRVALALLARLPMARGLEVLESARLRELG